MLWLEVLISYHDVGLLSCLGSVLVVVDTLSKEQRRAIHQFVQLECEGLVSTTDEVNGQKVIRVAAGSGN